jgi:hypothetical protein
MSVPASSYSIPDPIDRLFALLDHYKNTPDMNEKILRLSEALLTYIEPANRDSLKMLARLKVVICPKIQQRFATTVFNQTFGKNPVKAVLTSLSTAVIAKTSPEKLAVNLPLKKELIRAKLQAKEPLFTTPQERIELLDQLFSIYQTGLLNEAQDMQFLDLLLQAPTYVDKVIRSPQRFIRNLNQENSVVFLTSVIDFEPRFFIDNFSFFLNELGLGETDEVPPKLSKEALIDLLKKVIERAPYVVDKHFVEWYLLLSQFGMGKKELCEIFDQFLKDPEFSSELMEPLGGLLSDIMERTAPIRHHEADLLGFFFDLNPDEGQVLSQLSALKEKHPEVDTILGFRDRFIEIPDSKVINTDPQIKAIEKKSGQLWKCISREANPEGGYFYRFRFKPKFLDPTLMQAKRLEIFPAVELVPEGIYGILDESFTLQEIQQLNKQLAYKKAWLGFAPLAHKSDQPSSSDIEIVKREVTQIEYEIKENKILLNFMRFMKRLGFRIDQTHYGFEVVFPDREVLLQRYNDCRTHDDLPEIRIIDSDGVASDIEFCEALIENDALISEDKEFFHDIVAHVIPLLFKASYGNREYNIVRAQDIHALRSQSDQLRRASEELTKEKSDLLKPKERVFLKSQFCYLETILGATADILSNRFIRPGMPYDVITPDRILSADSWQRYFVKRYGMEYDADQVRSALALINRVFPIDFS